MGSNSELEMPKVHCAVQERTIGDASPQKLCLSSDCNTGNGPPVTGTDVSPLSSPPPLLLHILLHLHVIALITFRSSFLIESYILYFHSLIIVIVQGGPVAPRSLVGGDVR